MSALRDKVSFRCARAKGSYWRLRKDGKGFFSFLPIGAASVSSIELRATELGAGHELCTVGLLRICDIFVPNLAKVIYGQCAQVRMLNLVILVSFVVDPAL